MPRIGRSGAPAATGAKPVDNAPVSALDSKIDELYQQPLSAFTAARNAFAKSLGGDEGRRVRTLAKPTVIPWAINQLYWRARPLYDRLLKSGDALREAQFDALKGRKADVRGSTDAHRKVVADAVRESSRLASAAGLHADAEPLARALEALSLAAVRLEHPGRLTEPVQPAGFEALSGVQPLGRPAAEIEPRSPAPAGRASQTPVEVARARRLAEQVREREAEEARRRAQAELRSAERALEQAQAAEAAARRGLNEAQQDVRAASQALEAARERARR